MHQIRVQPMDYSGRDYEEKIVNIKLVIKI